MEREWCPPSVRRNREKLRDDLARAVDQCMDLILREQLQSYGRWLPTDEEIREVIDGK
jgi:hypothetical protein